MRWPRRRREPSTSDVDLTVCRSCASDTVIPTDWAERGRSWWMRVRCGACGASREFVVADAAAQRYDADLDRGMGEIGVTLQRLERERMATDVETFSTALRLDLLDANDFAF
jgi:hypothetical protein